MMWALHHFCVIDFSKKSGNSNRSCAICWWNTDLCKGFESILKERAQDFADDMYEEFYDYEDDFEDEDEAYDAAVDYWNDYND